MAYKEVLRVEISEVIRRWQAGNSRRHIASGTGLSKDTVGKYIAAGEALGIARDGPGPGEEQLSRLALRVSCRHPGILPPAGGHQLRQLHPAGRQVLGHADTSASLSLKKSVHPQDSQLPVAAVAQ